MVIVNEHFAPAPVTAPVVQLSRSTLHRVETDAELLGGLQRGDELAFTMLVQRYQMPMLRLARSMCSDHAIAEEAVQETWMGVVRGIDRFEGRSSLKTWLFRILVNRVRSARSVELQRRLPREPSVDPEHFDASGQWAEPVESWEDDIDERMDASAVMPVLLSALDGLPAASTRGRCPPRCRRDVERGSLRRPWNQTRESTDPATPRSC